MLKVQSITASYGKIQALRGVSLHVSPGDIVTLIGANGAGKTTILNTISGLVTAQSGKILFADQNIIGLSPENIVRLGISQVPEGRQIFAPLSVMDNLLLGAYPRYRRKTKQQIHSEIDSIFEIFPILKERRKQLAGTLSGGEQQMLAIGRGLMSKPKLCMLDEPSYGLAPLLVGEIFRIIGVLNEQGTTLLLVEQNVKHTLEIAHRAYLLENGKVVLEGTCESFLQNGYVRQAYLGL